MRRKDREVTDLGEIRAILGRARVLHLGLNAEEEPYVVPMHLLRRDGRVFVEIDTDEALLPAALPCAWGASYACVMGRGRAAEVEDAEEKAAALRLLMRTQTGRDFEISPAMAGAVCVLRIDVESFTAKRRK